MTNSKYLPDMTQTIDNRNLVRNRRKTAELMTEIVVDITSEILVVHQFHAHVLGDKDQCLLYQIHSKLKVFQEVL